MPLETAHTSTPSSGSSWQRHEHDSACLCRRVRVPCHTRRHARCSCPAPVLFPCALQGASRCGSNESGGRVEHSTGTNSPRARACAATPLTRQRGVVCQHQALRPQHAPIMQEATRMRKSFARSFNAIRINLCEDEVTFGFARPAFTSCAIRMNDMKTPDKWGQYTIARRPEPHREP